VRRARELVMEGSSGGGGGWRVESQGRRESGRRAGDEGTDGRHVPCRVDGLSG